MKARHLIIVAILVTIVSVPSARQGLPGSAYLIPDDTIAELRMLRISNPAEYSGRLLTLYGPRQ